MYYYLVGGYTLKKGCLNTEISTQLLYAGEFLPYLLLSDVL
jgi:hypothetical protein